MVHNVIPKYWFSHHRKKSSHYFVLKSKNISIKYCTSKKILFYEIIIFKKYHICCNNISLFFHGPVYLELKLMERLVLFGK